MKNKKHFCYEIYKNIAVWSRNGNVEYNPCSFFQGYIKKSDRVELEDVWNQSEHRKIMMKVETDTPISGCQPCYKQESAGLKSRRQSSKELYEEFFNDDNIDLSGPQGLDYSVGNLCNLKCIICGPQSSTAWVPDFKKLRPEIPIANYDKHHQLKITNTNFLKNIKSIHFHGGGEPLLSDHHVELLTKVKEAKGLADVRVFYNTNGTVKVSDRVLKLWEECKLIELYFSIDDVGERFEYQRTNANWNEVQQNLSWFMTNMPHNHMFNINCVWSYLNLYYLNELVDWHKENFSANRYGDPTNLIFQRAMGPCSIRKISSRIYTALNEKFSDYPDLQSLLNNVVIDNNYTHNEFLSYINRLDKIRDQDFKKVCPEWSEFL